MLNGQLHSTRFNTTGRDIQIVLGKTRDDLAVSLEIMMVETRMAGDGRSHLRGACCILREEETEIKKSDAVKIVMGFKGMWTVQNMPARVLICQRAIEFLEASNVK